MRPDIKGFNAVKAFSDGRIQSLTDNSQIIKRRKRTTKRSLWEVKQQRSCGEFLKPKHLVLTCNRFRINELLDIFWIFLVEVK